MPGVGWTSERNGSHEGPKCRRLGWELYRRRFGLRWERNKRNKRVALIKRPKWANLHAKRWFMACKYGVWKAAFWLEDSTWALLTSPGRESLLETWPLYSQLFNLSDAFRMSGIHWKLSTGKPMEHVKRSFRALAPFEPLHLSSPCTRNLHSITRLWNSMFELVCYELCARAFGKVGYSWLVD